jgi:CBS domain-containing protein
MMVENDCGCVPVIDEAGRPVGVITDRDIACRAVAQKHDTRAMCAADCMTTPVVAVARDETVDECCDLLETNQIRRVLVVDDDGSCCGIVALADIARHAEEKTEEVVEAVSRPSSEASVPAGM